MKKINTHTYSIAYYGQLIFFGVLSLLLLFGSGEAQAQTSSSGSAGVVGSISAPPPSEGATISFPTNGQTVDDLPIVVTGICPDGLLVKLFKNNVFAGSVQCEGGNFSLQTDLFIGTNEIIARVFDDLDQPGPDSNLVSVTFASNLAGAPARVTLTSNFAKRGAFPGDTLSWPVILSGGTGPYAFSVDWGDGKEEDLFIEAFPGTVDLSHIYDEPGVYNVVVKAVDANGVAAFLQLVAVANGPLSQELADAPADAIANGVAGLGATQTQAAWWPSAIALPFVVTTFWLGKRYAFYILRKRLEHGEHPFADF